MLLQLVQWLRAHYPLSSDQPVELTEKALHPLAELVQALQALFMQRQDLKADEVALVIEGLIIIAECYVAQRYGLTAVGQQLQFLSQSVQPLLASLKTNDSLSSTQAQSYERRISIFQADVLAHQHAAWRELVEPPLVAYEQVLSSLQGYCEGIRLSSTAAESEQAAHKLNQWEAHWLAAKAQSYLWPTLESLKFSALTDVHASPYVRQAQKIAQLLQHANLLPQALQWHSRLLTLAVQQQWPSWLQQLADLVQALQPQALQIKSIWKDARDTLKEYRDDFDNQLKQLTQQPSQAISLFNTQLIQFTQKLWLESEQLLGPAPIKYCVLALGSMSQRMLSAYSDVEYALLTETAEAADWEEQGKVVGTAAHYIKTLCEVFEFKVVSIGESNTGYKLDNNSQPRTEPSLRGTPDQLVEHCLALEIESHDGLVYSLLHAIPLQGDQSLFKTFQDKLNQAITQPCTKADHGYLALTKNVPLTWHQYWALAQFKRNEREYVKYLVDKKETPDLKKPYLKLLRFMVLDLALYLNLPAHDFTHACEQLVARGYLSADVIATIKEQVNYLLIERSKLHLAQGKEDDSPLPEHQVRLEQIQQTLLAPYFDTIHLLKTQGFALWQQAFWLACVPHHLSHQPTPVALTLLETGFNQEELYLPPELLQKVFAANGQIKATTPERNSAVFEWGPYCLKIPLPDAPKLEVQKQALQVFIARDYVINQLSRALGWLVTPAGCAVKLQFEIKPGQTVIYYGWLSQRLVGRDLENAKRQQPALLKSISPEDYTALFLLSLLIYPEDGQPRNFMVVNNSLQLPIKLYSLDNKRVFVDPIDVITSGFFRKTQTEQLKLKTCLYFLPQFKTELSAEVWSQCLQLDLAQVRDVLIAQLQGFDTVVVQTLGVQHAAAHKGMHEFRGLAIPAYLLYGIVLKLEQLLHRFTHDHPLLAIDCLKQCEPELYKLYEKHLAPMVDYYQTFKNNYRPNSFGQHFSTASLGFINNNKLKARALGHQLLKIYPSFTMNINWKSLSAEQQYHLLHLLKGQALTEVNLSHCIMLKNENLEEILKASPQLKLLNISNCPHLSPTVFNWFSRYCKELETLILDNNFWIKRIDTNLKLPQLNTLSFQACSQVDIVHLTHLTNLTYIYRQETVVEIVNAQQYAIHFNTRGNAKMKLGQFTEAIRDYTEAIQLQADEIVYYHNRSFKKNNVGQSTDALKSFIQAAETSLHYFKVLALQADEANYYHNRGFATLALGQQGDALLDADKAISLNSKNYGAYILKARALIGLENYVLAAQALAIVLNDYPSSDETNLRMQHYVKVIQQALAWFKGESQMLLYEDFQATYNFVKLSNQRAYLCGDLVTELYLHSIKHTAKLKLTPDRLKTAHVEVTQLLHQVITDCPKEPLLYYYQARVLFIKDDKQAALQSLQQCLMLAPHHQQAHIALQNTLQAYPSLATAQASFWSLPAAPALPKNIEAHAQKSPINNKINQTLSNASLEKIRHIQTTVDVTHPLVDNTYWYSAEDVNTLLTLQLKDQAIEVCAGLFPFLSNLQGQAAALFKDTLAQILNKHVPAVIPINLVEAAALNQHGLAHTLQGTHWIGLCIIPLMNHATYSHKIVIVDSLGNGLDQDKDISALNLLAIMDQVNNPHPRRTFWEKISQLVGLMQGSIVERDINRLQIIVTGTIQQTNGSDCGAFVVQNLVSLLQENKLCEQTGGELRQLHAQLLNSTEEHALEDPILNVPVAPRP